MADIYNSETTTKRGEGQEEKTIQKSSSKSTRTSMPGVVETVDKLEGEQVTTELDTPGTVIVTSTENRPAVVKTEQKPSITSKSVSPASIIKTISGEKTTIQSSTDDIGVTVKFKVRILNFYPRN